MSVAGGNHYGGDEFAFSVHGGIGLVSVEAPGTGLATVAHLRVGGGDDPVFGKSLLEGDFPVCLVDDILHGYHGQQVFKLLFFPGKFHSFGSRQDIESIRE